MKTADLNRINTETLAFRDAWQAEVAAGSGDPEAWHQYKHTKGYFGFYDCKLGPSEFAMFSANDDIVVWHLFWTGRYETGVMVEWARMLQGADVVLDLGAYTGCMALMACNVAPKCRVICYEPMLRTVERLKINVAANGLMKRISIEPFAVSDKNEKIPINLTRPENFLSTGNSIKPKNIPFIGTVDITSVVLDDHITLNPGERVSCIKLDVEGHEYEALQGMAKLIETHRPEMIVEVWPQEKDAILAWMEDRAYVARDLGGMNWIFTPRPV